MMFESFTDSIKAKSQRLQDDVPTWKDKHEYL